MKKVPPPYNITEHVLPEKESRVYTQLEEIIKSLEENQMKINTEKTKFMVFNTARKLDFTPKFEIEGNRDRNC